jgi:hybrid cluster-associated redox disulfide protein
MEKIKKTDKIGNILSKHPESSTILFEAGLGCIGCPMMSFETIEQGCRAHGMSDDEIDKLIEILNKKIKDSKNG